MAVMDSLQTKQAAALAALSTAERERLARLAARAQVSAEAIWQEVWLYGFDDVDESVQAELEAREAIARGVTIANEEVMAGALRLIGHAERKRKKQPA